MTYVIFDERARRRGAAVGWHQAQLAARRRVSYCWSSALRAADSTARPSALSPSARASCSEPTSVPAITDAARRARRLRQACRAPRRSAARTRCADASRTRAATGAACRDAERGDRAAGVERREVRVGEIAVDEARERRSRRLRRRAGARARRLGAAVAAGALQRLDQQRVARLEVGVEAAVREAGLLHHVGHADAGIAVAPDRARRDVDDALVGLFLAAVGVRAMVDGII